MKYHTLRTRRKPRARPAMQNCSREVWANKKLEAGMEKRRNPRQTYNNQQGKPVSISEVVEARKNMVREARQYMQVLHEMLMAAENGTLENHWSEEERF